MTRLSQVPTCESSVLFCFPKDPLHHELAFLTTFKMVNLRLEHFTEIVFISWIMEVCSYEDLEEFLSNVLDCDKLILL